MAIGIGILKHEQVVNPIVYIKCLRQLTIFHLDDVKGRRRDEDFYHDLAIVLNI